MSQHQQYGAPWGTPLKLMSALSLVILVGVAVIGISSGPRDSAIWILSMIVMPLAILVIAAFFTIRGYVLTPDAILVQRLGWNSRISLSNLTAAEVDPNAMSRSIRTFGNGGLFCIAGAFRNKKLGAYRAFATDPKRSVVLKFFRRTVVVTPDKPEKFVLKIKELRNI